MGVSFGWPSVINNVIARFIGGTSVVLCSLHFATDDHAWVMPFLFYEYAMRLVLGPKSLSVVAHTSGALASNFKPIATPANPKRFASACGTLFSGLATYFYYYTSDPEVVNGVPAHKLVLGGLLMAAGLESLLDFCLGCKIYQVLQWVGMFPQDANCSDGVCKALPDAKLD